MLTHPKGYLFLNGVFISLLMFHHGYVKSVFLFSKQHINTVTCLMFHLVYLSSLVTAVKGKSF